MASPQNPTEEPKPAWGPNDGHTILNHDIQRVDGPAKAAGAAKYTYDVRLPGMLYGLILHSPHACAEIVKIDTSAAEKIPGVKAVVLFPDKKVLKYEGDPIAAAAAISPEIAEDGLRAIKIVYKKLPHVVTVQQALKPNAPRVYTDTGGDDKMGNVRPSDQDGDKPETEAAFKKCDVVIEHEFYAPMQHHACLETHGVTVDYRGGDSATIYASTQGTFTIPRDAARVLDLKVQNVTAIVEYMGGGFGSKFGLDIPGAAACMLSKKTGVPVRVMLTRAGEFTAAGNRSGALQRVKAGATKDGKLVAMEARQYKLSGVGEGSLSGLPYLYQPETHYRELSTVHTHQDSSRAMRAPGHPEASFPMESIMDDLAYAIGMDPVEFRKRNIPKPADQEAWGRQMDRGAKEIGWERRAKAPGGNPGYGPEKALKRGLGMALGMWGGAGFSGCKVDVFIAPNGEVTAQSGTQDLGTGSRTLVAAIVAEELGLPVHAVQTRIGHSSYGNANPSGGSTTTGSMAPAVKDAAFNARLELFAKVAPVLGVPPDQLSAKDGKIFVTANPSKSLSWNQACATLGMAGLSAHGVWKSGLSAGSVHGVNFAEVEVDTQTGRVRILKMVAVHDMGLPLNRLAAESQINGGMILGIGYGLLEGNVVDAYTGNMLNTSMDDYKVPGCMEMPEMVALIDDGDTRDKVIGFAEATNVPGAGAIGNAIYNACGVRVLSLPITPDKILDGMAKQHKGGHKA